MAIDLEQIKKNYANFDDSKLEYLAKNETASLEPEVIDIITAEIKKRGLDSNLEKGIEAQSKKLTEKEINELKSKISNLSCPVCGQNDTPLVGSMIRTVRSFIVFTTWKKAEIISCTSCAEKKRKEAVHSTLLYGWWMIPVGIIATIAALIGTLSDKKKHLEVSDRIITKFVIKNRGEIRTNWDDEDELVGFIGQVNNANINK